VVHMANCNGRLPVSAKVDREMRELLDEEAERLGVYRSEAVRRVLDHYAEAREGSACPHCGQELHVQL
jgi:hypothetical protein